MKQIFYALLGFVVFQVLAVVAWCVRDYYYPDYIDGTIGRNARS